MSVFSRTRLVLLAITLGLFLCPLNLFAQEAAATETAAAEQAPAPTVKSKTTDKFERAERVESMRYRHLWIAYSLIWLLVFLFVFRTWKLGQQTATELESLNRRLKSLEEREE